MTESKIPTKRPNLIIIDEAGEIPDELWECGDIEPPMRGAGGLAPFRVFEGRERLKRTEAIKNWAVILLVWAIILFLSLIVADKVFAVDSNPEPMVRKADIVVPLSEADAQKMLIGGRTRDNVKNDNTKADYWAGRLGEHPDACPEMPDSFECPQSVQYTPGLNPKGGR